MSKEGLAYWKSFEALDETIRRHTTIVADDLHLSGRLVRMWCSPPSTIDDPDQSGARNPLDRLETIITTIAKIDPDRAYVPIEWLCARFGFMPPVKMPASNTSDKELMQAILTYNKEFGETSQKLAEVLKDNKVSKAELKELSKECMEAVQAVMGLLAVIGERVR